MSVSKFRGSVHVLQVVLHGMFCKKAKTNSYSHRLNQQNVANFSQPIVYVDFVAKFLESNSTGLKISKYN